VKDRFVYNGDLYVEVENFNRHKRASIAELTALLRPAQKPSKSALTAPSADPVGHWYEAQLLHYGLPPSKTKAVAKVRLLDALNAGKLSVPPEVVRLENEMKKEYQAADRKAKAAHKAQMAAEMEMVAKGNGVAAGKKRKQAEDKPQPSVKKAKKLAKVDGKDETPKSEPKKSAANAAPKQPASKKTAVAKSSGASPAVPGSSSAPEKPLKKQTAKRSLGPPGYGKMDPDVMRELVLEGRLAAQASMSAPDPPRKKQTAKRSLGMPGNWESDLGIMSELASKEKTPVKKGPAKTKKEPVAKKEDIARDLAFMEEATIRQEPIKTKKESVMKKEIKREIKKEIKKEGQTKQKPTIKHEPTEFPPKTHSTATKKEPQVKVKKERKPKKEGGNSPAIKKDPAKKPA
ncbi:MAG: hypothetical protein LQ347_006754, partial [Umbilicaria vellea]